MYGKVSDDWKKKVVDPDEALMDIKPGMSIFLGSGVAEPRSMIRRLMKSDATNLQDLELIQLLTLGDLLSVEELSTQKYRLKTVFQGWVAFDAITTGRVDLIPYRFSKMPTLVSSGAMRLDAGFIQITPPDEQGYCSLGVSVDVARRVMERSNYIVGEINEMIPWTMGDTFVHIDDFKYLVRSTEPPIYFPRWPSDDVFDKVAANVASLIPDGACLAYSIGPLFEALTPHLKDKKNLGIHTSSFTDATMDLIKSGAVTNRNKNTFRGKSLASYALGTQEMMRWLHWNPLVEFQEIDKVADPENLGKNDDFYAILPARKVDLTGRIALHFGKINVTAGPAEAYDMFMGASLSNGGQTIIALPSRNKKGDPNILFSVEFFPNHVSTREYVDYMVTEYGVAYLTGRTIRERAQALIDIAHPDDRPHLIQQAKLKHLLYKDQIYLDDSGKMYPQDLTWVETFKDDLEVRFRAIRPSDEEDMRRLFYRFSDKAVYYRYFTAVKTMPHAKMQEYVNIDYRRTMSIVGIAKIDGKREFIAEARYVINKGRNTADVAFVVDEKYQGKGIATHLLIRLIEIANQRGIDGFTADVLATNKGMMKVFEKSPHPVQARLEDGIFQVLIPFSTRVKPAKQGITYVR